MQRLLRLIPVFLAIVHCTVGPIRQTAMESVSADSMRTARERLVLSWREGKDLAVLERLHTGFTGSRSKEIPAYREWLYQSPEDCEGFPSRDYWSRRSYPVFFRSFEIGNGSSAESGDETTRRYFLSLRNAGLLISSDGGNTFKRPATLPARYTGKKEGKCDPVLYRDVVGLWQHPQNPDIILAVNIQDILLSFDGGRNFRALDFDGLSNLKSRNKFASVAARLDERGRIDTVYLGTAYNGIKRLSLTEYALGSFWKDNQLPSVRVSDFNRGLPGLLHEPGVTFYEHILDMKWIPEKQLLVVATLFDPGVGISSTQSGAADFRFRRVPNASTDAINESLDCDSRGCLLTGSAGKHFLSLSSESASSSQEAPSASLEGLRLVPVSSSSADSMDSGQGPGADPGSSAKPGALRPVPEALSPRPFLASLHGSYLSHGGPVLSQREPPATGTKRPEVMNAFYISPTSARLKQNLVFHLIDRYGFNAAVIDVKDDFGRLIYGSRLPIAEEMNNTREVAPVRELVKKLKDRGIYTIARQVVFKDLRMHRYKGHRNAIRNRYTGGPWTVEGDEQWTDAFSEEVQSYNIDVAREVLELGFDEVQFDYIRFPSDGPIYQCLFSHAPAGAYRTEAIESFLRRARFTLNAPISIDIFGYNAIYRAGAVIGQDVLEMGSAVDFVSPMHYSSHFGTRYLNQYPRESRVHRLLELGTERPLRMSRGLFSLRPWLQAFPMMNHVWGYGHDYMVQQMQGSLDGGATGFLFWGPIAEFPIAGRAYTEDIRPHLSSGDRSPDSNPGAN